MKALKYFFICFGWVIAGLLTLGTVASVAAIAYAVFGEMEPRDVENPDRAVAVVELKGELLDTSKFQKQLQKKANADDYKAIVVRIDSPGGSVGASEEAYRVIKQAAEKKSIVCSFGNLAASGGLYAGMGCDKIVSNAGTLTGSIGVIMMLPKFKSLLDRFDLGFLIVKSGKYKDTGSPLREPTSDDIKLLEELVAVSYEQFVGVIAEARGLELDKVKEFADGRIILGEQALELGLVDQIGGIREAAKLALELEGVDGEPELIGPKRPSPFEQFLEGTEVQLRWWQNLSQARLLYKLLP